VIVGLQIGKKLSTGRPGKNYMTLLGRQMNEYSLMGALHCDEIKKIYISTDSSEIKSSAAKFNATIIDRPADLATPAALTEDVLLHAYEIICDDLDEEPEMVVLLFANTPAINKNLIEKGIHILRNQPTLDSCFSVVKYNMFSPTRAKKMKDGIIIPFVDAAAFGNITSIRGSQGDVYFADFSIQILRPNCFHNMKDGTPPIKWMGKKTYGLETDFGFDLDEEWQIPVLEYWLKKHGFTETDTPYE